MHKKRIGKEYSGIEFHSKPMEIRTLNVMEIVNMNGKNKREFQLNTEIKEIRTEEEEVDYNSEEYKEVERIRLAIRNKLGPEYL